MIMKSPPFFRRIKTLAAAVLFCLFSNSLVVPGSQAIVVEGVENHGGYADRASFRVVYQPGYRFACLLDNRPAAVGAWVDVTDVNYHELWVRRTTADGASTDTTNIQFIVRSSARGYTEYGLPPWTPYPVVSSSPEQFEGLRLQCIVPGRFPQNLPLPVVLLLEQTNGQPAWLNGAAMVSAAESTVIPVRRGFGSRLLSPATNQGTLSHRIQLHPLRASRLTVIEGATDWKTISGSLDGDVVWPENSRYFVTHDLKIARGASLTIGAGSLVILGSLANITVDGRCVVQGLRENPAVFMPADRSKPWGGFQATNSVSEIRMSGTILTGGGGDPGYFAGGHGLAHRMEQPVVLLSNGATVSLADCFFIDNPGQMGNGDNATLNLERCLVQRCVTAGQFNGGSVTVNQSALIEFPEDTPVYADADEDAIYLNQGSHSFRDTVIGWTRDDGIDAILGSGKSVLIDHCWIESCFHEGFAWSGYAGTGDVRRTVMLNCGQGMEAGWSAEAGGPVINATEVASLGNLVGARFADNYDWTYAGFLRVTHSILLCNLHDVWGMNWTDWSYRTGQMDVRNNFLSAPNPWHPENKTWIPATDGWRLGGFMAEAPDRPVGAAFAFRNRQMDIRQLAKGIPLGLSSFSTNFVTVDYRIGTPSILIESGRVEFAPGETIKTIFPTNTNLEPASPVIVSLSSPKNARVTGWSSVFFAGSNPTQTPELLGVRSGSELVLMWSGSRLFLDQAADITGPWAALKNAASPMALDVSESKRFYRLRK